MYDRETPWAGERRARARLLSAARPTAVVDNGKNAAFGARFLARPPRSSGTTARLTVSRDEKPAQYCCVYASLYFLHYYFFFFMLFNF